MVIFTESYLVLNVKTQTAIQALAAIASKHPEAAKEILKSPKSILIFLKDFKSPS